MPDSHDQDEETPTSNVNRSHFPIHKEPRVWLITAGDSPIGISITRQILKHGDSALVGISDSKTDRETRRRDGFDAFLEEVQAHREEGWSDRLRTVDLDIRMVGACQAAVAQAVETYGKIDILLCCTSQAIVGTVEELAASQQTLHLVRDQFETNYFGPVNIIKAALPPMRRQKSGHIMIVSGITAHIGTPGLSMHCAAGWALEGFCDSLAYEIAPFNIKLTILQCSIEIGILTNLVTSVPPIEAAYSPATNRAPLFRGILNRLIPQLPGSSSQRGGDNARNIAGSCDSSNESTKETFSSVEAGPFSSSKVVSMYPPLSPAHMEVLVAETVYAITSIGGHENPPSRHIVGQEGVASVKEKLKTVSEELEDFIQTSCAIDIMADSGGGGEASRSMKDDRSSEAAMMMVTTDAFQLMH